MQFEDAKEGPAVLAASDDHVQEHAAALHAPRPVAGSFLDEQDSDSMPEEDDEDEDGYDSYEAQDAEWAVGDDLNSGLHAVMDQDWADAAGDFTKRYNRMKQQVLVAHGSSGGRTTGPGSTTPASSARAGGVLPAVNRSRRQQATSAASASDSVQSSGKAPVHGDKVTDQLSLYSRFASRLQLDPLYQSGTATRKGGSEKILVKDKSDRATNEQVLDPRTRLILFKMIGRGVVERIDGCVSTGKEANVYHALSPEGKHIALKIFKTSILVFKDRDRYVTGEFRFKSGYARSNPRKMVRLWAEKELRNLRRMRSAGVRVPEAIEVRENVLVMDFVAQDEWQASPRLKDAELQPDDLPRLYMEIVVILRAIFHRCRLVHADFSEYNILYHDGHLWVIDVSQSIEHEHPAAFDFLRADIQNADDFFARRGVQTLGLRRTFNFVTRDSWVSGRDETDEDATDEVVRLLAADAQDATAPTGRSPCTDGPDSQTALDEAVFAQSYIPRTLDQVYDVERDVARVLRGEGADLIYADLTGVAEVQKAEQDRLLPALVEENAASDLAASEQDDNSSKQPDGSDLSGSEDESEDEGEGEGEDGVRRPRGKKFEDKDEKKARRQDVKEKAREKRATKMKKGEKARRIKKSSGKR
ncbi:hypothetical protein JCM10908_004988 [Rhodotorula pacifica]|uniref:protein kinase RIO1 n=1 Tax=Rhodotorula pacifica TaxID=1495444 RepID=UPI003171460D